MTRYQAYLAGAREEAKVKDAEIAALREACKEVLDYEQGVGEYDYSRLSSLERADASFTAWLEIREKVRRAMEEKP